VPITCLIGGYALAAQGYQSGNHRYRRGGSGNPASGTAHQDCCLDGLPDGVAKEHATEVVSRKARKSESGCLRGRPRAHRPTYKPTDTLCQYARTMTSTAFRYARFQHLDGLLLTKRTTRDKCRGGSNHYLTGALAGIEVAVAAVAAVAGKETPQANRVRCSTCSANTFSRNRQLGSPFSCTARRRRCRRDFFAFLWACARRVRRHIAGLVTRLTAMIGVFEAVLFGILGASSIGWPRCKPLASVDRSKRGHCCCSPPFTAPRRSLLVAAASLLKQQALAGIRDAPAMELSSQHACPVLSFYQMNSPAGSRPAHADCARGSRYVDDTRRHSGFRRHLLRDDCAGRRQFSSLVVGALHGLAGDLWAGHRLLRFRAWAASPWHRPTLAR